MSMGPNISDANCSFATVDEMQSAPVGSIKQGTIGYVAAEDGPNAEKPYFKFLPFDTLAAGANVKYASSAMVNGVGDDTLPGRWIRLDIKRYAP